jgi:hypothetical protein
LNLKLSVFSDGVKYLSVALFIVGYRIGIIDGVTAPKVMRFNVVQDIRSIRQLLHIAIMQR